MKPETQEHLDVAEKNRVIAYALSSGRLGIPAPEWAIVTAFYSAVHVVNAYLRETYDFEPETHERRTQSVHSDGTLIAIATSYDQLRTWGFHARYTPAFRPDQALVQHALQNLERIRSAVLPHL